MPDRTCQTCGARFWQGQGRPAKRCKACRGSDATRYDRAHHRVREQTIASAYGSPCVRCGEVMYPGQPLDLDHDELGGYLGYAHASCNRSAGAMKGAALRRRVAVSCKFHAPVTSSCPHSSAW